jgi:hypothetical protein
MLCQTVCCGRVPCGRGAHVAADSALLQALYARHSVLSSPHSRSDTPPDRQRRISHGVHSMGHTAMDAAANAALQSGLQPGLAYPFHHVSGSPTPGNLSPGSMPEMYTRSSGPSGIDPATGMLVTYSPSGIQPHTMMGMHQTSNMSPRSEPLMTLTVEGYRSTSIRKEACVQCFFPQTQMLHTKH